jgi:hypothetical protein
MLVGRSGKVLVGVVVLSAVARSARADAPEYQVKAEFIERFTRFIDWPAGAFADDKSPFVLCIAGTNPFGAYLDAFRRGRPIKNRAVTLRSLVEPSDTDGCHLVFVASDERKRLGEFIARTSHKPILTIGDSDGYARAGVLINLYLETRNIRFEVNVVAVKASGLKFSSKLLKLAHIVDEGRAP